MSDRLILSYQLQLITPGKQVYLIQQHAFNKLLSAYMFCKFTSILITKLLVQNLNVKPNIKYF